MDENYLRDRQMHQDRMEELAKRREELEQYALLLFSCLFLYFRGIVELKRANACDPAAERKLRAEIAAVRSIKNEVINNFTISAERSVKSYKALMKKASITCICSDLLFS